MLLWEYWKLEWKTILPGQSLKEEGFHELVWNVPLQRNLIFSAQVSHTCLIYPQWKQECCYLPLPARQPLAWKMTQLTFCFREEQNTIYAFTFSRGLEITPVSMSQVGFRLIDGLTYGRKWVDVAQSTLLIIFKFQVSEWHSFIILLTEINQSTSLAYIS